jgi:hypothetical protein
MLSLTPFSYFSLLIVIFITFGFIIVRYRSGFSHCRDYRRAQQRIAEIEGHYIEGRYQPFGIPVRGYIEPPVFNPSSNEVWFTVIPMHDERNHDAFLFVYPWNFEVTYLYYPQRFNRFHFGSTWHRINVPIHATFPDPIRIQVHIDTHTHTDTPTPPVASTSTARNTSRQD